jgi:hypothetical protein
VTGASAHSDYTIACIKAFDEIESTMISWKENPRQKIDKENVKAPHEHGLFYSFEENLQHVDWLLEASECEPKFLDVDPYRLFNPIVIDLYKAKHEFDFNVVRVIANLMPLNFGYGSEHFNHERLNQLNLTWNREYPSIPHFFP